jgi:prolyl oligopeptidase
VVLDPNALNQSGTTAIDWFVPSHDGKLLAVSMSDGGSEAGTLYIYDVGTGKQLGPAIPRVQFPTAGGSLAWHPSNSGFWYTRYPGPAEPAERQHFYQQVYFHKLGDDPVQDTYVMGRDLPKLAEIVLSNRQNPNYVMVSVGNGDGGELAHYVIGPDGAARQISQFKDKIIAAMVGSDNRIYLVSHQDAPRGKLLRLDVGDTHLSQAKLILPESDAVLQRNSAPVIVTGQGIYVPQLVGGPSRVAILELDGTPRGTLPLPDVAAVGEIQALGDGTLLYEVRTFLKPPYFLRYSEATGKAAESGLAQTSPWDDAGMEVVREFATSKDGTKIPLNIVRRKDCKFDGSAPLLLNGYGGYSLSMRPQYLTPALRLWLDAGGTLVIANLRGGGEYGEAWHEQGMLTNKQNVFDDFAAAAQYLITRRYSRSARMAAIGGSNGGIMLGAVLTQHPELFRAVVSQSGFYDMLRLELDANGAFNTTEFGSVRNPAQLKALYAYSPYHNVVEGAKYPAIFMPTGENDGRVNPMHSRKMIARLQAATASGYPVYLGVSADVGHGNGSALSIRLKQSADVYSFLFDQLGIAMPAEK